VKGVIIGLRRMATVHELKGKAATEVQTVCGYFTNNASRMKYHEYLAAGCDGRMRGAQRTVRPHKSIVAAELAAGSLRLAFSCHRRVVAGLDRATV